MHHFWVQDWYALSLQITSLILTNDYDMVQQYWAATWISSSEPEGFCFPGCSLRCSRLWRLLGDTCHHAQRHRLHPLWPEGGQVGKLRPADWNSGFIYFIWFIWIYMDLCGFMWIYMDLCGFCGFPTRGYFVWWLRRTYRIMKWSPSGPQQRTPHRSPCAQVSNPFSRRLLTQCPTLSLRISVTWIGDGQGFL